MHCDIGEEIETVHGTVFHAVCCCACRGQRTIQLYIIVERLIFGDCDDIVVRAFILVHSLLLMSSFTFDICIM